MPWELKGDHPLRYFIEPVVLTANWAVAQGYADINMAGLSGGGWTTTVAAAIDKRITASFPIAGSVPCSLRLAPTESNPVGYWPNQRWTGTSRDGDFDRRRESAASMASGAARDAAGAAHAAIERALTPPTRESDAGAAGETRARHRRGRVTPKPTNSRIATAGPRS